MIRGHDLVVKDRHLNTLEIRGIVNNFTECSYIVITLSMKTLSTKCVNNNIIKIRRRLKTRANNGATVAFLHEKNKSLHCQIFIL